MRVHLWLCAALLGCSIAALSMAIPESRALAQSRHTSATVAQVYNGPGLQQGTDSLGVEGIKGGNLRTTIANIVNKILTYVALIAVVVIIIAGIWLIVGLGDDGAKDKAKKIVLYTAIGLILILISKALVMFFIKLVE